MHGDPTPEDAAAQRAILALALAAYPKFRTIPELGREIGGRRVAKRAIRRLVEDGLLEQREAAYCATPIAIRCHRLDNW
jgi:hypothetical protein